MWKLSIALGLAAAIAGFAGGWKVHDWRDAASELAAARNAVTVVQHQAAVGLQVAVASQQAQDHVRIVTRTLIEKVPEYVTPAADARYPLPWGFVRLHDAAVAGVDLPAVAAGPDRPDDAPSDVAASTAAAVIVSNYGDCHADQDRLAAFQAWARGEGLAK
jgi:hypothetical protein